MGQSYPQKKSREHSHETFKLKQQPLQLQPKGINLFLNIKTQEQNV